MIKYEESLGTALIEKLNSGEGGFNKLKLFSAIRCYYDFRQINEIESFIQSKRNDSVSKKEAKKLLKKVKRNIFVLPNYTFMDDDELVVVKNVGHFTYRMTLKIK